jgi:diaminohydroxyphosphoribosylaminopyrimidine deaminase/5-amino-6-(5-phosphoribosylamino)uracil reductase
MSFSDHFFMQRALQLANLGQGSVAPNPMVGCVIVHKDKIIGEGYHQKYGQGHAEVNAVAAVKDKSLLAGATVYVTLEPCSHTGKTPPCANLLIEHKVKKVVVCSLDTNPLVAGQGIAKLQAAGIEVHTGVLDVQGRSLNKRFFTFIEQKRPYVVLKWAQSTDGFIAKANYESVAISGALAKRWVHQYRSQETAIMVGTKTALYDNPRLDVRHWTGQSPLRVVTDSQLLLPKDLLLFDGTLPTLRYNLLSDQNLPNNQAIKLADLSPKNMLEHLYQQNVQSVLIEGGTALINSFIEANLWDEARVFTSPMILNAGIKAPLMYINSKQIVSIGQDRLAIFERV